MTLPSHHLSVLLSRVRENERLFGFDAPTRGPLSLCKFFAHSGERGASHGETTSRRGRKNPTNAIFHKTKRKAIYTVRNRGEVSRRHFRLDSCPVSALMPSA